MKFIDEKGRLFGKINIIDFLVLFFCALLLLFFYHSYKILNKNRTVKAKDIGIEVEAKKPENPPKETFAQVIARIRFYDLDETTLNKLVVGLEQRYNDNTSIRLNDVINICPYKTSLVDFGYGKSIYLTNRKEATVLLDFYGKAKNGKMYVNDNPILINGAFDFRIDDIIIKGVIEDMEIKKPLLEIIDEVDLN